MVANKAEIFDWAALALPDLHEQVCLQLIQLCTTTTTTTTGVSKGVCRMIGG